MRRTELISASAGSGKTYALTKTLSDLLAGGAGEARAIRPEGVRQPPSWASASAGGSSRMATTTPRRASRWGWWARWTASAAG